MPKIIISGCNGRMGQVVARLCANTSDMEISAGIDVLTQPKNSFPVYADPMEYSGPADVIVDFSNPASLNGLLSYCVRRGLPAVICTTGHSDAQRLLISDTAKTVPLFMSGNMSLGVNLLTVLLKKAASVLGEGFDVEIIEKHHKMKIDAPSGTALMLANAVASGLSYAPEYVYERESKRQKRSERELGITSLRGGSIVGEHEVYFCGPDEVLEFKHTAYSREVFASGALAAARFISGVKLPGLYDMSHALAELLGE